MGLDMYFYKTTTSTANKLVDAYRELKKVDNSFKAVDMCTNSSHWSDEERQNFEKVQQEYESVNRIIDGIFKVIGEEIMYFRKFNGLHGFIINELNNGVDDCSPIILNHRALKCIRAVLNHDKELIEKSKLPDSYVHLNYDTVQLKPVAGFFFGDTSLGKYWEDDVNAGADKINDIIENLADDEVIIYLASW